jgi:SNF2 family DNA or RNA helicase
MQYVRYDGRVTSKNRIAALDTFINDPNVNILILSITCGAVGLNLTAASRVYLMEPHWNPTVEEQALARIHRIGQTRQVTTVRYIMQDSYEEHVIKVQDRKRHLATVLLSQQHLSGADSTRNRLHHLKSLLL